MARETETVISGVAEGKGFVSPLMRGIRAACLLEVEDAGTWSLCIEDGAVRIEEGAADASCRIHGDDHEMALVLRGQQNLLTATMQGRVVLSGDRPLLLRIHQMLRSNALHERKATP
jgi:hypothetical protein